MSEASAAPATAPANGPVLAEVLTQQLKGLLEAGNYDGVKLLLQPVQEVDIAEAIGGLPRTLQALAFRLLPKNEAIAVYEYLEPSVQQTLLERLRSSEVLELVEEMSPDDRVDLFDASELARATMGDSIFSNMMIFGAAWQRGLLPLSLDAIRQAIDLNGTVVDKNLRAFDIGR